MDDLNDYIFDIDLYQKNNNSTINIRNSHLNFEAMKKFDFLDFIIIDVD